MMDRERIGDTIEEIRSSHVVIASTVALYKLKKLTADEAMDRIAKEIVKAEKPWRNLMLEGL